MFLHSKNPRPRLTLWYVSLIAVLLVFAWGATSAMVFWTLRNRLDRFGAEGIETVESLLFFTLDGKLRLPDYFENNRASKDRIASFVEVRSASGSVLFRNERLGDRSLGGIPVPGEGVVGYCPRSIRLSDGKRVRVMSRAMLQVATSLWFALPIAKNPCSPFKELAITSTLILPLMLVAAGFAG